MIAGVIVVRLRHGGSAGGLQTKVVAIPGDFT